MTDIQFATIAVSLLSLIFSQVPFVQLVYALTALSLGTWEAWVQVTFIQLIATAGGTIYRRLSNGK